MALKHVADIRRSVFFVSDSPDYQPEWKKGYLGKGYYAYEDIDSAIDFIINEPDTSIHKSWYIHEYKFDSIGLTSFYLEYHDEEVFKSWLALVLKYIKVPGVPENIHNRFCRERYIRRNSLHVCKIFICCNMEAYFNDLRKYMIGELPYFDTHRNQTHCVIKWHRSFTHISIMEITKKEIVKYKLAGVSVSERIWNNRQLIPTEE